MGAQTLFTLVWSLPRGANFPPFLALVSFRDIGAICAKYALVSITLSHGLDEAMSVWMLQKFV